MSIIPVGSQVESRQGQPGIVVRRDTSMWPTLTPVKWVGTSFITYEDHRKLVVISLPAGDVLLDRGHRVGRFSADRWVRANDAHTAMLARARQRAGVAL